jgi:hypothetical protein
MSAGVPAPCHVAGNNDRYRSAPKASAPSASGQTLACRPQRACCGRWLDARWCTRLSHKSRRSALVREADSNESF